MAHGISGSWFYPDSLVLMESPVSPMSLWLPSGWAQAASIWEEGVQESDNSQEKVDKDLAAEVLFQVLLCTGLNPSDFYLLVFSPVRKKGFFSPERIPHLTGRTDTNYRYCWGEQREEMSSPQSLGLSVVGGTLFIQKVKFSLWCWCPKCSQGTKIPLQQLSNISGLKPERLDSLGKFNGKRCFAFPISFILKSLWGFWG